MDCVQRAVKTALAFAGLLASCASQQVKVPAEKRCLLAYRPTGSMAMYEVCHDPEQEQLIVELPVMFEFSDHWSEEDWPKLERFVMETAAFAWSGRHRFEREDARADVVVRLRKVSRRPDFVVEIRPPGAQSHVSTFALSTKGWLYAARRIVLHLDDQSPEHARHSVAHEIGHALGLGDEYERRRRHPAHAKLVKRYLGEEILVRNDERVMSQGMKVELQHGVVFWEALERVTKCKGWKMSLVRTEARGPEVEVPLASRSDLTR